MNRPPRPVKQVREKQVVMPGLVPGIHVLAQRKKYVDGRVIEDADSLRRSHSLIDAS
jgi:hypothetical protein